MTTLHTKLKRLKILKTDIGDFNFKESQLGSGGNSTVFLFERNGKEYAIKFLTIENDSRKIQRFKDEFFAMAQCPSHVNLLPQYHFDEIKIEEETYFIIISKKFDISLKKFKVDILDRLSPDEKIKAIEKIFDNICNGLNHLHKYHIIHRDLKPENIYINVEGSNIKELVIGDFGIAHFAPEYYDRLSDTREGERLANYNFSAPEQIERGHELTPSCDVFAIGQIILWLITGSTRRGIDSSKIIDHPFLNEVIHKCLQQATQNRPSSASDLINFVIELINQKEKNIQKNQLESLVWDAIYHLDEIIRKTCTTIYEIETLTDPSLIEEFLTEFNQINNGENFWFMNSRGGDSYATTWSKEGNLWVMNCNSNFGLECNIEKIHIYKDMSKYKSFFIIQTSPLEPFTYLDRDNNPIIREIPNHYLDYAYFFNGKCLSPKEAQNGYYRDKNGSHELTRENSYERARILTKFGFMIAPIETPIMIGDRRIGEDFIRAVINNNELTNALVEQFQIQTCDNYGSIIKDIL